MVIVLTAGAPRASAALAFHTDRADFVAAAAAGGVGYEDLEDNAVTGTPDSAGSALVVLDGLRASATSHLKILDAPAQANANTTPGGARYLTLDTNSTGGAFSVLFTLDQPVNAFGFNIIDVEEFASVGFAGEFAQLHTSDGGVAFFGVISDEPFATLRVSADTAPDGQVSFDDFAFTPEPASSLGLIALAATFLTRRPRRRAIAPGTTC
jgi:hypothetical protein